MSRATLIFFMISICSCKHSFLVLPWFLFSYSTSVYWSCIISLPHPSFSLQLFCRFGFIRSSLRAWPNNMGVDVRPSVRPSVAKIMIFKFYLLRHFSSDLEFDCSIWISGTISKFWSGRIFDIRFRFRVTWLQSWQKMRKWRFSKSISSYISQAILNLIVAYESMGQYLNLVGPDFRYSLSFSCPVTKLSSRGDVLGYWLNRMSYKKKLQSCLTNLWRQHNFQNAFLAST